MQKISNPYLLSVITKLFILLIVAKSLSLFALWFFPSDGVNAVTQKNYKPKYQRVDFKSMLQSNQQANQVAQTYQATNNGTSITNMILKGLYGFKEKGFAIIALKSSPKSTSIVSVGEDYSGYVLKTILANSVVFTKSGKEYILSMQGSAKISNKMSTFMQTAVNDGQVEKKVSRQDIQYYAKNPDKIWKDISIVQMKNRQGFKITNVRKNSKMDILGLQKGDVMIRANNSDLKSYKDAINLYKNINNLQTIELVVLRNNQEKEFVYEIH